MPSRAPQVFRHTDFHVAAQAVDTLVFCCKSGPGALQPIARLALTTVASKAAQDLGAAARKVLTLSEQALQDEVEELETAGGSCCWLCCTGVGAAAFNRRRQGPQGLSAMASALGSSCKQTCNMLGCHAPLGGEVQSCKPGAAQAHMRAWARQWLSSSRHVCIAGVLTARSKCLLLPCARSCRHRP